MGKGNFTYPCLFVVKRQHARTRICYIYYEEIPAGSFISGVSDNSAQCYVSRRKAPGCSCGD